MKKVTKKLAMALLFGVTALAGMSMSASAAKKNSVKITVKPADIKLAVGECIKIKKSVSPKDADQKWKFSSKDKDIALVSRNGNIVGLKGGTARIRVRACGKNTVKTIKVKVDGNALYVCKTSLAKFTKMGIATKEEGVLKYTIADQTWETMKFSNRTLTDTYITLDNVKVTNTYIESEKSYWLNARTSHMGKVEFVPKDEAATTKFEGDYIRPVLEIGTMDRVTSVKYSADGLVILDPSATGGSVEIAPAKGSTINAGIQGGNDIDVAVDGGKNAVTNIDLNGTTIGQVDVTGGAGQKVNVSETGTGSTIDNIAVGEGADDTSIDLGKGVTIGKVVSDASGTTVESNQGDKEVPEGGYVTFPSGGATGGGGIYETYSISKTFNSSVGDVTVTFKDSGDVTFTRAELDELFAKVIASGASQTITSGEFEVTFSGTNPSIGTDGSIDASGVTAVVTKSGQAVGTYELSVKGTYLNNYTVTADWSNHKSSEKITSVTETKLK
jgi:hypothetical protein